MTYSFINERFKRTPMPDARLGEMPTSSETNNQVEVPGLSYQAMQSHWTVIDAVKRGTPHLREAGGDYLPQEPFEQDPAYSRRLNRSCFSPWYLRLTRGLVGMVLRKPITFEGLDKQTEQHLDNINLLGDDINAFVREAFESAIDYGHAAIFVDFPKSEGIQTLAQETQAGLRPYWIHYAARDIIGWRSQIVADQQILTQVRLREYVALPEGEFGERLEERIKVYDLAQVQVGSETVQRCRYRIYAKVKTEGRGVEDRYELIEEPGFISLPYIPIAIIYTNQTGLLQSKPPMEEIAHLNVKHYQLSSDLDHALHLAAMSKLCLFGYDTQQGDVVVGVDEALVFDNPDGRAEWLKAPIDSFDALENRIGKIESQMAVLGLSSLVSQKNVGESAEAKRLDRAQGDSLLAVAAMSLQDSVDNCLQFHADYLNPKGIPRNIVGECQVNRDFDLVQLTAQDIQAYSQLQQLDQISLETFLELLVRGEVIPDEINIQEELARIKSQITEDAPLNEPEPEIVPETPNEQTISQTEVK